MLDPKDIKFYYVDPENVTLGGKIFADVIKVRTL